MMTAQAFAAAPRGRDPDCLNLTRFSEVARGADPDDAGGRVTPTDFAKMARGRMAVPVRPPVQRLLESFRRVLGRRRGRRVSAAAVRGIFEHAQAALAERPARRHRHLDGRSVREILDDARRVLGRPTAEEDSAAWLWECCAQRADVDVDTDDAEAPVLRGVTVLRSRSKNRRIYTRQAMEAALPKYEGVAVYINHPDPARSASPRDLDHKFGKLVNVRLEEDAIKADLVFNPAHPMAARVRWWATNDPSQLGLSHNAQGLGKDDKDGNYVVFEIAAVRSVDLVTDPATTEGLFS